MSHRPLKILQITSGRNLNGAVIYCGLLGRRLLDRGHQITTLCRPNSWFINRFAGDLGESRIITSPLARSRREIREMVEFVKSQKFDLIHTHMTSANHFGLLLKYKTGIPCVATAHHCSWQPVWRLHDYVIANSQATMDYYLRRRLVTRDRIETVYCYTLLEDFLSPSRRWPGLIRRQQRLPENSKMIGIVANVSPRKGQLAFVKALPQLVQRFPDLTALFIGNCMPRRGKYVASIRRYLLKHNLARRVRWLGRRDDIPMLTAALDVAVLPSQKEPLGLAAIEALASGTPVVASRVGGLPEIVAHGKHGLLVDPNRPDQLAQAISDLLDQPVRREAMGAAGAAFVQHTFDPDRLSDRVLEVYDQVLSRRQRYSANRPGFRTSCHAGEADPPQDSNAAA